MNLVVEGNFRLLVMAARILRPYNYLQRKLTRVEPTESFITHMYNSINH